MIAAGFPGAAEFLFMPHRILKTAERGMLDAYEALLAAHRFTADTAQRIAAERLQALYYELLSF
ncbi:MAG: hypothetical protein ACTS5G_00965, partial [Burkholderiales bacterium]